MEQASGAPLSISGVATVQLKIGKHEFTGEVIGADIKEDVLLGMDIGELRRDYFQGAGIRGWSGDAMRTHQEQPGTQSNTS